MSVFRWMLDYKPLVFMFINLPAFLFFIVPFFWTMIAFVLFMVSFGAQPGERRFFVPANLLMLILWASMIVAPN